MLLITANIIVKKQYTHITIMGMRYGARRTSPKTERNRYSAFSLVVTMVGFKLMYYVDFIAFMEEPEKTWNDILAKRDAKSAATT